MSPDHFKLQNEIEIPQMKKENGTSPASGKKKDKKKKRNFVHFHINYSVNIFSNNCIPKVGKLMQTIN